MQRQIVETGHVSRGVLGVSTQDVNQALADAFKLPAPKGALVLDVSPRGAGAVAGLWPGDMILQVGDKPISTSGELAALVTMAAPGRQPRALGLAGRQAHRLSATLADSAKAGREPVAIVPPDPRRGSWGSR